MGRTLALHGELRQPASRPRRAIAAKGFRPFFVLAAAYAVLIVPLWLAILLFAAMKLVVFIVRVARQPEFRVAAADYGGALAILLAGAAYMAVRHRAPGMTWLIAGVLVSLVAGIVQARKLALHRHFNHNDLYHVIQMAALFAFYRGGALLVDR